MKPDHFSKVVNVSLHHFSDASKLGYGQCSYIRKVNEIGRVHCSLLLGKSRVVPKKFISIPRLELNAAVLSLKMACLLKKELKLGEIKEWFWTENKVVIGYIKNDARRFKTFAGDRVQQITENTDVQQWCYVPTGKDPADGASTGLNAARVHSGSRWFEGAPLLWQNENNWPGIKNAEVEVLTDDPESRREARSYAAFVYEDIVAGLEERISSWPRLKRIIGPMLCFKKKLLDCIRENRSTKELDHTKQHCSVLLDLEGIKMAEKEIIRSVQGRQFGEELLSLGKGRCLKSCSSIVKLDQFIDDEGILRVGGRIQRSALANEINTQCCCQNPAELLSW